MERREAWLRNQPSEKIWLLFPVPSGGSPLGTGGSPVVPRGRFSAGATYFLNTVNPFEQADWDVALARCPDFSFFHGTAWTRVLVETYGFTPVWQSAGNSLLPLMEVDSWLTGRRGIALPFTDECAPLCDSEDGIQNAVSKRGRMGPVAGLEFLGIARRPEFLGRCPRFTGLL